MEQKEIIKEKQEAALQDIDIDPELKEKIRLKFKSICLQFPKMKVHRAMRKAGEYYKVKFNFE